MKLPECFFFLSPINRIVPVSEASVIVAASAEHRQEAIEAVAFAIDAVKSTAAIWKKVANYSIAYVY